MATSSVSICLWAGRFAIASIHRHLQLASSEPREVYHYQISTAGLQRGQKKKMMLLGSLSHDAGQPALLLSYSSATAGFQEAHWALPVEYGTEICSYQRSPHRR